MSMTPTLPRPFRQLAVAAALAVACSVARADEPTRSVQVVGEGDASAMPDRAWIEGAVEHVGEDLDALRRQADAAIERALTALRRMRIDPSAVQAHAARIEPQYRHDRASGQGVLAGYRVSRGIAVQLDRIDRLGELMQALLDAGINRLSPAQLSVADAAALQDRALAEAAADARRQAAVLAEALGARLGAVQEVEVFDGAPMPVRMRVAADVGGAESMPVHVGRIIHRVRIRARFALTGE